MKTNKGRMERAINLKLADQIIITVLEKCTPQDRRT